MSDDKADETGQREGREREIKVTDRRMFTPEGELREEYREVGHGETSQGDGGGAAQSGGGAAGGAGIVTPGAGPADTGAGGEPPVQPPSSRPAGPGAPQGDASPGPGAGAPVEIPQTGAGPAPSFLDLVGVLAEPVPLYLGDAELPDGRTVENLEAARLYIDLLDLLRRKTAGNLSSQESAVLEDVIYRLRMRYVQKRG